MATAKKTKAGRKKTGGRNECALKLQAIDRVQAVIEFDPDGTVLTANENFLKLMGYSLGEIKGRHHRIFCDAAYANSLEYQAFWAKLNRGEYEAGTYARVAKDGRVIWIQAAYYPLMDRKGKPFKVVKFASDVTDRETAIEHMREELKVREEILNVTSIVSESDLKGNIMSVNEKFLQVSKYPKDELIGFGHDTTRHPDMPKEVFKQMWATIGRGQIFRGVIKNRAKDGTPYYVDAVIAPFIDKTTGKPRKYLGVWYDITEQEIQRQNMKGLLDGINRLYATIEFDLDGTVLTANENFLKLMGYSLDEIKGRHHRMFCDPAWTGTGEYVEFWKKLNRNETDTGVYRRIGKNGKEVWLQAAYCPVADEMGRPFKVVKFATDITEQKTKRQDLEACMAEVEKSLGALAQGDLTQEVQGEYQGELGTIKTSINAALAELRNTIATVRTAVETVTAGSEEITKGNEDLSQRTTEQASALEETSASMEELNSTVRQNADNAKQANQLAIASRDLAIKGGAVTSRAVEAMGGITKSSKKIADIITVVDEIAFQTNLLALNAAVEAARAGEHGRGFAVVAAEVRNLAQRSAMAAKEIKGLINESLQCVEEGGELVTQSGKTLEEVVNAVKRVADIIAEISAASQEQAGGIDEVNKALLSMDETTQQNAALVEQTTSAAQSMKDQMKELLQIVKRFTIRRPEGDEPVERDAHPAVLHPAAKPSVITAAGPEHGLIGPAKVRKPYAAGTVALATGNGKEGEFEEF